MSRNKHICATEVTHFNGKKTHIISSTSLTADSVRLNAKQDEVDASMTRNKKTIYTKKSTRSQTISGAWFLMNTLFSHSNIWCRGTMPADGMEAHITWMVPDVWKVIFGFTFGISQHDKLEALGHYAIAINRPSFFPQIEMDLAEVVDTVIRADEDKVRHILNANPRYLLKKLDLAANPCASPAFNSVGTPFTGTPFQAAFACGDDDMGKMMKEHFKRLTTDLEGNSIDGMREMQRQITDICTESLIRYQTILLPRVLAKLEALRFELLQHDQLDESQIKTLKEIQEKIKNITCTIITCKTALKSRDIQEIMKAHTQAQVANKFDVSPYFEAIKSANTPAELAEIDALHAIITATTQAELDSAIQATGTSFTQTDDSRNKPFSQLNLFEKMNCYREELRAHMQGEIIFNPHHIQNALDINYEKYVALENARADTNYKKRDIIWSMGVGTPQRFASETYRQDIRQGTYYLIGQNEPRSRPSCFNHYDRATYNIIRNALPDVSIAGAALLDGFGFKFACGALGMWPDIAGVRFFSKLMSSKNNNLGKLMQPAKSHNRLACAMM